MTDTAKPGAAPDKAPGDLRADDVVEAYRWLLGRNPESPEVIERRLAGAKTGPVLRRRLIRSEEFRRQFEALALETPAPADRYLPADVDRLVLLHVPKTGGTTIHVLLAAAVGPDGVSAERHNRLWRCTGAELASARLFSGHYDRRCLSVIPGRRARVVTILREPRQRLLSLYRFLRAHGPQLVAAFDLELAAAARTLDFGPFLRAALQINPAAVDNTYLRAFGAHLPYRRWDQRAEPAARQKLQELGYTPDELMRRAAAFLDEMAAVGILEAFDHSVAAIFAACGLDAPASYNVKQRLTDLIADNPNFVAVEEVAITAANEQLVSDLTRFDKELYQQGWRILSRSGAADAQARVVTQPAQPDHPTSFEAA